MKIYRPTPKALRHSEYDEDDRVIFLGTLSLIFDNKSNKIIEPWAQAKRDSFWELDREVDCLLLFAPESLLRMYPQFKSSVFEEMHPGLKIL